jgi:flagellar assembly factor FliW
MTMKAKTRLFGEIDIADDKIITLEKGMIGFPSLTHFSLIYDEEKKKKTVSIMWLQSMDDPDIAFPVVDPHSVKNDYAPNVNAEIIAPLGEMHEGNTYVLVTVTVPHKVEDFSVNLKAPVVINMDTLKGVQLIVEDDYPVKYKVYEILKTQKEKAGGQGC